MTWPKEQNFKVKNLSVLCIRNTEDQIIWPSEQIREKISMSWLTFFGKNLNSKIYVFLCIRNIEDWIIWPSEQIREKMSMSWMTWPKGQNLKVKNLSILCIRNIEDWITWPSEQIREKIFTLTSQNPFFPSKLKLRKLNFPYLGWNVAAWFQAWYHCNLVCGPTSFWKIWKCRFFKIFKIPSNWNWSKTPLFFFFLKYLNKYGL